MSAHADGLDNLASLTTMDGACHELIAAGQDFGAACRPQVINAAYRTGMSSFAFMVADSAIVSFFGADSPMDGDKAVMKVTKVGLNLLMGDPPPMHDATGTCLYTNPYAGPALVKCEATLRDGSKFRATFVTDGSEPNITQFDQ